MAIRLLVLAAGVLRRDPRPEASRVEAGHVDLGLALHHHLRQVVARPASGRDAEGEPLGEPHVAQARRGADQGIAVGGVADGAVEVGLQPDLLAAGDAVDEALVLHLDPLEVEREEVGAKALGDAVGEAGGGAALVRAEDPAAALLADVPFGVGVAQDGVLGVVLPPGLQPGVRFRDDVLVLDRDGGDLDAEERAGALGVVAGGCDDVLGGDLDGLVGGDQVAAALRHLARRDAPGGAVPAVSIDLPAALDGGARLPRALGHGHRDVGRVDVAVGRVEDRALQVVGPHQGVALADLARGEPFERHARGLSRGRVEHVLVHAGLRLRHAQVADDGEAGVQAGLGLQRLVELDRSVVDEGRRVGHVEVGQQAGGVPGAAGGQLVALQEERFPAGMGEVVCDGGAHRAATDDEGLHMRLHPGAPCPAPRTIGAAAARRDPRAT